MCEGSRLESASSAVGCHTSRAETNCRGRRELFRSGTLFSRSVNACTVLAVEVRRGGTKRMTCVGDAGLDLGGVLPRRAVGGDLVQRVGHVGGWCWADRGLSACRRESSTVAPGILSWWLGLAALSEALVLGSCTMGQHRQHQPQRRIAAPTSRSSPHLFDSGGTRPCSW
jgi:hypothetical protein